MASYDEPMDVDEVLDSDDKVNSLRPNGPSSGAEKGYEDLDVSELDMRLRLSCTPLSSPIPTPRRFTGSSKKLFTESGDYSSVNDTMINDSADVTMTNLSDGDHNGNISERDSVTSNHISDDTTKTITLEYTDYSRSSDCIVNNNATITLDTCHNIDNTISTPIGPTVIAAVDNKESQKTSTSPIMRGLKSVFSMFRPSQSPIPASDGSVIAPEIVQGLSGDNKYSSNSILVSTPTESKPKILIDQPSLKGNSPQSPDNIIFNEDFINDLQWNDDTTIIFNKNKLPTRKLYTPLSSSLESHSRDSIPLVDSIQEDVDVNSKTQNSAVEYMDISMGDSNLQAGLVTNSNLFIETENKQLIRSLAENVLMSIFEQAEKTVNELSSIKQNICNEQTKSDDKHITNIVTSMNSPIIFDNTVNKDIEPCCKNDTSCSEYNSLTEFYSEAANTEIHKVIQAETCDSIEHTNSKPDSDDASAPKSEIKIDKIVILQDKAIQQEKRDVSNSKICEEEYNVKKAEQQYKNNISKHDNAIYTETKMNSEILNDIDNENTINGEEFLSTVSNNSYVSLNVCPEQESFDKLTTTIVPHLDNIIACPTATTTSTAYEEISKSHIDYDEIVNPFITKSRVTMTPPRDIKEADKSVIHEIGIVDPNIFEPNTIDQSTYKNSKEIDKSFIDSSNTIEAVIEEESQKMKFVVDKFITMECDESNTVNLKIDISSAKELEDASTLLESIIFSTPSGSDIVVSAEWQDHSDSYLSANSSGRESGHLLDSDHEIIDKFQDDKHNISLKKGNINLEDEITTKTEINLMSGIDNEIPKLSKSEAKCIPTKCKTDKTASSDIVLTESENYSINNKMESSCKVPEVEDELVTIFKNPLESTSPKSIPFADIDNPFATKTKICMSPPVILKDGNETPTQILLINSKINALDIKIEGNSNISTLIEKESNIEEPVTLKGNPLISENHIPNTPSTNFIEILKNSSSTVPIEDMVNPFITKNKLSKTPPETPPSEKSVMLQSCENDTAFIPLSELVTSNEKSVNIYVDHSTVETALMNENTEKTKLISNVEINNTNFEQSLTSDIDGTVSSADSNLSQNITVKEVKTEDEDTIEGTDFVDIDNAETSFETKCKIRISTPVFNINSDVHTASPQVILCSDMTSDVEDFAPEEEYIDCPDEEFKPGELFINADTFDFLMNQNTAGECDHGKESLFLKFDPLCAIGRKSNEQSDVPASVDTTSDTCCIQSQPGVVHDEVIVENESVATPTITVEVLNNTPESISAQSEHSVAVNNSTPPEKPVLAVMPAVNDQHINIRTASYTPTRPVRRSVTVSSPAIAAIDRLISLSGNSTPANQNYYMENNLARQESNEAFLQMQQLLREKESEVDELRIESKLLQDRLTDLEIQMRCLQEENEERLRKINELKEKLAHKTALNKNMAAVVEEYERAISGMIGENEQEKQRHESEKANLVRERDEQIAHLNSMEVSFSDLHTKYERTKQVILTFKANEEVLRNTIEEFKESQKKLENNYEILKQQAVSKLNNANAELDKIKRSHEAEVLKLNAQIKRKELHVTSLEESLAQKTKANEELTAICDELINKVG